MSSTDAAARHLLQALLDQITQQRDSGRIVGAKVNSGPISHFAAKELEKFLTGAYARLGHPSKYRLLVSVNDDGGLLSSVNVTIAPV